MNWLTKKVVLKPAALIGVLLLLCGIGVAYAVTSHSLTETPLWPGTASIVNAANLKVDETTSPPGYELVYNDELTEVTAVEVDVKNVDAGAAHSGTLKVAIVSEAGAKTGAGEVDITDLAAGTTHTYTADIDPDVTIGPDLGGLNLVITETA
jgi:hypothetical protein